MKPGEAHDSKGVPIYPGDLLRSFHFRGARGKAYYLYHVAMWNEKHKTMEMVPVREAAGLGAKGGRCWFTQFILTNECVVIDGQGPGETLSYEDRPKQKLPVEAAP